MFIKIGSGKLAKLGNQFRDFRAVAALVTVFEIPAEIGNEGVVFFLPAVEIGLEVVGVLSSGVGHNENRVIDDTLKSGAKNRGDFAVAFRDIFGDVANIFGFNAVTVIGF